MDIYAEEAKTKYAKEFKVAENITENFVLPDAEVTVEPAGRSGLGFGSKSVAAIKFSVPEQLTEQQADDYRSSAEEHATHFADVFNSNLMAKGPDGQVRPLTSQPIARAEGSEVHLDLGGLRQLLSEHTIADQLPKISESYSVQYMTEKAANHAQNYVQQELQDRRMAKQQAETENKILGECEKALEDPEHLGQLMKKDPRMAANVQANLSQMAQLAEQVTENPEIMDTLREQNERFANLVEKVGEKLAEKKAAAEQEAPAQDAAPGKWAGAEKARESARETEQDGPAR